MTTHLMATLMTAENGETAEQQMAVSPWVYGIAAFSVFLILLFVVTRLNLDR